MELELNDIQGLIVSSYKHQPFAAYVLLRIGDPAAARLWLGSHIGRFTDATGKTDISSINIAFTFSGLSTLGLDQGACKTFSAAFQEGMATARRSRILGDEGDNAPDRWNWGGSGTPPVDVMLLCFTRTKADLDEELARLDSDFQTSGAFERLGNVLPAQRLPEDGREHFGFNDGIGQPVMAGTGNKARQFARTNHATELPPGEFLLGQPNIYGVISDSPVMAAQADPRNILPTLDTETNALNALMGMHDFGRNGTYLVFRQFAQNVASFYKFLEDATRDSDGSPDPVASEFLAAKMIGRWRSGAPLVLADAQDDPAHSSENNFSYKDDLNGLRCPIGAHIRRSNPRDSLGPDPETALNSANRHRIIRRGRSYGTRLQNPMMDDGQERGLHFICLNSDIERQFEFVQQTWLQNPVFGGLYNEVDPLIGNRKEACPLFTVQNDPLRERVKALQQFVMIKGGAYFFLPGIRALRFLATM